MYKNTRIWFRSLFETIFPFRKAEIISVWPILILGFFIGINYTIFKDAKDAILVTAEKSGAEVIPFIKVWGVVPGAILFTFLYAKLSCYFRQDKICYIFLAIFLSLFSLFSFIIYPLREHLHLHSFADFLETILPIGFKGFISIIRYWSFSCFYIVAEMWSSIMLSIMYWRLINSIFSIKEAKSLYALFGLAVHISGAIAGQITIFISSKWFFNYCCIYKSHWQQTLSLLTILALISGFVIYAMYKKSFQLYLEKHPTQNFSFIKNKKKPSFSNMIKKTISSSYISSIAIIVLSYNICINLTEVLLKNEIHTLYKNPLDFNIYMNKLSISIALVASLIELLCTKRMLQFLGWKLCALSTPIIMLCTSALFFPLFLSKNTSTIQYICSFIKVSPLTLCVFFGSIQNILCRSFKFCLFDATKEMAFIPLSNQEQLESKSIIDGIGSRVGKSGGSLMYQGLLLSCSSIASTAPFIGCIVGSMSCLWILGVKSLWKKISIYEQETQKKKNTTASSFIVLTNKILETSKYENNKPKDTAKELVNFK